MKTVDELMALADDYSMNRQRSAIFSVSTQEARATLLTALQEVVQPAKFNDATLMQIAAVRPDLIGSMPVQPVAQPSDEALLRQALGIISAKYAEEYDEAHELIVERAIRARLEGGV